MLCDPDEKTPLCNNDIFQNAVRGAHRRMNSEQARALRDTAAKSGVWSSTIHLADDNVFSEAFFVNAVVVTKRVDTDIVYVDDTACVNAFMLPVVVMLARDASNNTHSIAWGTCVTGRSMHSRGSSGSWLGSFPRRRSCAIGATHRALH